MTSLAFPGLILVTYAAAIAIAWHLGDQERWRDLLTDRFWYGVPWGTLVTIAFVLAVYLFVQGGIRDWHDPTVVPFRAWSYFYPTGILTASFTHSSSGHLIGNLVGTLALAPIAEYAWGHYPGGSRKSTVDTDGSGTFGSDDSSRVTDVDGTDGDGADGDGSDVDGADGDGADVTARATAGVPRDLDASADVRERLREGLRIPWVRAFVCFPVAVVLVGLVTAAFALGPVIGFSGVVFAFGGFAIVRYPISTLIALLVSSVLSTTYYSLQYPIVRAEITGSAPSPPGWATVAIQGHALGILLGIVLGLAVLQFRNVRPNAGRVFLAVLVYGMTRELWAVYWFEGNGVYVLLRGLGVSLVVLLAIVVAVAATSGDRPLRSALGDLPRSPTVRQLATGWVVLLATGILVTGVLAISRGWPIGLTLLAAGGVALVLALPAALVHSSTDLGGRVPSGRHLAIGTLVVTTALLAGPAIYPNLATVGADPVPNEEAITVEGYSVTYAEDVRNRMIPVVDLPTIANGTTVPTSGVIVVNEDRHIWTNAISKQYLASEGDASVSVGGVGWQESIYVERIGWTVAGNDTAYVVELTDDGETIRVYESPPKRAAPVLANHTVAVVPGDDRFRLRVFHDNQSVGTANFPPVGNSTSAGPLSFHTGHHDGLLTIFASVDGTRVPIAQRETYREE